MSAERLFFGASFIPAEFTDIYFEVKIVKSKFFIFQLCQLSYIFFIPIKHPTDNTPKPIHNLKRW